MLGHALQICKPYNRPAKRMKKVPGDNNRDINGLLNRDSYKSEAKSWNDTDRIWQTAGLTWHPREERVVEKEVTIYKGLMSGWLISY